MRVNEHDRTRLERIAAGGGSRAVRARIVLLAGAGHPDTAIAARLGISRPTVALWRERYQRDAAAGLEDQPRPGRPTVVRDAVVLAASVTHPPQHVPGRAWSARALAGSLRISPFSVRKVWRRWGFTPGTPPTLGLRPPLIANIRELTGLYLNPPDAALTLRVDGEPDLPPEFGSGLARLVVAPSEPAAGTVPGAFGEVVAAMDDALDGLPDECFPRQRDRDLVGFLRTTPAEHPNEAWRIVVARPQMLQSRLVRDWMDDHPSVPFSLPPSGIGWPDVLEAMVAATADDPETGSRAAVVLRDRVERLLASAERGVECISWQFQSS